MKIKLTLLITIFLFQLVISQNYQTVEEVDEACTTLGFSANEEAEIAVDKMMEIIGLQKNFKLQECPNINNAIAKNIKNSSGNMIRYILYDNEFFNKMDDKAGTDWAAISILAHEIGHHLNAHSLNNEGSNHEFELDADYFSGLILSKMGANLKESQSAVQTFKYEKATSTHPAKIDRLNEIKRGWTKGNNYNNSTQDTGITESNDTDITENSDHDIPESNETGIPEGMEPLVQEYYRKAMNGNANAQVNLGQAYATGIGVKEQDHIESVKWYRTAAEQGNAAGQVKLGRKYGFGWGVEQDYQESMKLYRKAAEQGFGEAYVEIGMLYIEGYGVEKDYYEAEKWFRKGSEGGDAKAQYWLAWLYLGTKGGVGIKKDYNEAIKWFHKSAEQGDMGAQYSLGIMIIKGRGIKKNKKVGNDWLRKAARQGHGSAQRALKKTGESW